MLIHHVTSPFISTSRYLSRLPLAYTHTDTHTCPRLHLCADLISSASPGKRASRQSSIVKSSLLAIRQVTSLCRYTIHTGMCDKARQPVHELRQMAANRVTERMMCTQGVAYSTNNQQVNQ